MSNKKIDASQRNFALGMVIAASIVIIALAALFQISAGSFRTRTADVWQALTGKEVWTNPGFLMHLVFGDAVCSWLGVPEPGAVPTNALVIWNIRIPRLLTALMVGINLAFSGAVFQAITRNEMASPYLLGVSQGSGLMILVVLVIIPRMTVYMPLFAMLGGIMAFLVVYTIAWNHGASPVRLILAGIIVGAIAGALQTALTFFIRDLATVQNALAWTTGSLIGVGWDQVRLIFPWTALTVILCLALNRKLDILLLGDQTASSLGLSVEHWRFVFAVIAIMSAASVVSVAGLVGFVGLIVPHIVRSLVGSPHNRLFCGCLFAGPALMAGADMLARLILNPVQLPVGAITGTIGGIFFLILMRRKREFGRL